MQNANGSLATSYDETPYSSYVFSHCQPVRLHAIATLKGLNPAPVETARVLEIGCSFGGNLLPFAIQHPHSYSIGIDLSEQQINMGKKMMQEVGVDNIQLICADISKVNFENIQFDYIICHGVFSWVPQFVQDAILNVIKNYLSPNGIAFISYNVYPGWHNFDLARNLMQFGSNPELDLLTRTDQAFELLKFTNNILKKTNSNINNVLQETFNDIILKPKYYISHEYLEEYNTPLYFSQFLEKIKEYNLSYVNDSDFIDYWRYYYALTDKEYYDIYDYFDYNIEKIEQYFDFLYNRPFRTSIITHIDNFKASNDIRKITTNHNFNNLNFTTKVEYIRNEQDIAYWKLTNDGRKTLSTPLSDSIFKYIQSKKEHLCSVSELKEDLKNKLSNYNEHEADDILLNIIYSYNVHLSFYPLSLNCYNNKPKLNEKYRKLAIFLDSAPNVTSISNYQYQRVNLDFFSSYIFKLLDGTRTIHDLVKLVQDDIAKGIIFWDSKDETSISHKISDIEIRKTIINILDLFYSHGFFNHYDNESH